MEGQVEHWKNSNTLLKSSKCVDVVNERIIYYENGRTIWIK